MSQAADFAITGGEIYGEANGTVGLLLPDGSGERSWIDLNGHDPFFPASDVLDTASVAEWIAWALNELRAGNTLYSSPRSHPHDLQPYPGRPVAFVTGAVDSQ